jgi:hypothetical protein
MGLREKRERKREREREREKERERERERERWRTDYEPFDLWPLPNTALLGTHNIPLKWFCSGFEAGSYLRPIDSCITQVKAQGPSRTCKESKGEEGYSDIAQTPAAPQPRDKNMQRFQGGLAFKAHRLVYHSTLSLRVIKKKQGTRDSLLD